MQHLDEGTIHAWLDGQLPREEALEVEAHVAECRPCADAVAEARGLIAASSRILLALDNVPRDVVPRDPVPLPAAPADAERPGPPTLTAAPVASGRMRARRRWFNGVNLALAATIVVAIGTTLLTRAAKQQRQDVEADQARATVASTRSTDSVGVSVPVPMAATPPAIPAAPAPAPALGAAGQPAEQRFATVAPANEAARSPSAPAPAANADVRRLADAAVARSPAVARAKVVEPVDAPAREKTANDLAKDARAERAQSGATLPVVSAPAGARAETTQIRVFRGSEIARADSSASVLTQRAPGMTVAAAAGAVRGRVTDANNTGLPNAMVTVVGTSTGVVTNAAGEYAVGGLTSGTHRLLVRRIGYDTASREVTVAGGATSTADIVMRPVQTMLSEVVTTGTAASAAVPARKSARGAAIETPPGAPVTATQSNAVGCYELGITATTASRNGFRQVPRRVALDAEIVPANADGVWYRARDLARTGAVPNGLWRPTGADGVEIEWTYGSRTARVRVAGPAGSMMRGTLEEIDRATATGEAGTVVAVRRSCTP